MVILSSSDYCQWILRCLSITYFFSFAVPALCLLLLIRDKVDSVDLWAPDEVTATRRGLVKVECQYNLRFKENTKYWCKGPIYELCKIVVKTPRNRSSERFFIADDREAGVFTITMTSLIERDEDMYWCVISRSGRNVFKGVRVVVTQTGILEYTRIFHYNIRQRIKLLNFDCFYFYSTLL